MKKYLLGAAAAAALTVVSSPAHAAANLIEATVTSGLPGAPTGRIWNTDSADGFYALFLQQPFGNYLNPNEEVNDPTTEGLNAYTILGEGFFPGAGAVDSDPTYTLTLMFADGATLVGSYTRATQTFIGGTAVGAGGALYTLTNFTWERLASDNVQAFDPIPGGDPNDYFGGFRFTAANAVPEPATWAMMLMGFGAVGYSMRRRSTVKLAQAV